MKSAYVVAGLVFISIALPLLVRTVFLRHSQAQLRNGIPLALFCVVVGLFAGTSRVYYGGGLPMHLMQKKSLSFRDTVVNLDDILGMPRIAVAAQHPQVKRQLEDMGIIETDEQLEARIKREVDAEMKREMRRIDEDMRRWQRQQGY